MIIGKSLKVDTKHIYFLNVISQRGDVVNLKGKGSIELTINKYIALYFSAETKKVGSQLPIRWIENIGMKIIVLTIAHIFGSASLHQPSKKMVFYVWEFLRPILYDWSTTFLTCMKSQLTGCKQGILKNSIFGSLFYCFFFERVPMMSPRVDIHMHYMIYVMINLWN